MSLISNYIKEQDIQHQKRLLILYDTIKNILVYATEKYSYGVPTFYLNGNIVHFADYKKHISLYPGSEAIEFFHDRLINYKTSKGTIQFRYDQELPIDLIKEIVQFSLASSKKWHLEGVIFIIQWYFVC
ncbi:iron chaperone [Mycoplasma sp. P36-A1]|uniref:iron chaperone n=1 Tax=Mycoplasma sp. P36-A1 TaxID=3252900 RepID=UPI003C2CD9D3